MRTSKLTHTELKAKFGIPRNILHGIILNNFHIKPEEFPALQVYRIQHFTGIEFRNLALGGIIKFTDAADNIYHCCVIYKGDRNCYLSSCKSIELRVSFRAAREEYNLPAYALVEIVQA